MSKTPLQTIINPNSDPGLNVYATNAQNVPVISSANVVITNTNQYITEIYNLKATAGGNVGEIEFNDGSGLAGDTGLTYDAESDSLTVSGNVFAGNIRTDSLQYANGTSYVFSGSDYGNSNVASYLPTYSGRVTAGNIVSTGNSNAATFNGSGAGLTNLPAANIVGNVANATYATTAGVANSVAGSNVSGTVNRATYATVSDSANSVSGSNVSGTVSSATTATTAVTVTASTQPNITSIGTLSSLSVSANLSAGNISLTGNANVARINVSTTANLGNVGNVKITGGSASQYLQTDGLGNLVWATVAAGTTPNLLQVTNAGGTTNVAISITDATISSNYATGALTVAGGAGIGGNLHTLGHITSKSTVYAGQYSDVSSFTVPVFLGRDAGAAYIQGALVNTNEHGSADWVAYGDQSSDAEGWSDFGFTGSTFNDTNYTITKANDGYFFVQGLENLGGNLVIATGGVGGPTHRDIVFATGGFSLSDERMRLNHEDSTLYIGQHGDGNEGVTHLDVNGNVTFRSDLTMSASHAELVFGDASATGNPGMSSTGVLAIVANKGVSEKQWVFNTDGSLSVPGTIVPTSNVAYDLGSDTQRFRDLYLSGTTIHIGGTTIGVDPISGNISLGNITIEGDGTITGDSVAGQVANALVAGDVYNATQANITSVGTLAGLSAGGNITFQSDCHFDVLGQANFSVGNLHINGGASGQYLQTDGAGNLSWHTVSGGGSSYGDSNVLSLLDTYVAGNINFGSGTQVNFNGGASFGSAYVSGNITTGNISGASGSFTNVSGNGSALHHLAGANVTGQVANALLAGTVYTGAQPNITSVGTLSSLSITGNTTSGNVSGGNATHYTKSSSTGLTITNSSGASTTTLSQVSNVAVLTASLGSVQLTAEGNITGGKSWVFDGQGNLTLPDNTVINTAPKDEPSFTLVYSAFTITTGKRYMVDALSQSASTTLPTTPDAGDAIFFMDAFGTFSINNLTIHPSDANIMGSSGNYVATTDNAKFGLAFNGIEWRLY